VQKYGGMKNKNKPVYWKHFLCGIFLAFLLFPSGNVFAQLHGPLAILTPCNELDKVACVPNERPDCEWVDRWILPDSCEVVASECWSVNEQYKDLFQMGKRQEICVAKGCNWKPDSSDPLGLEGECFPFTELCRGREQNACAQAGDSCEWSNNVCRLKSVAGAKKAVETLSKVCSCKGIYQYNEGYYPIWLKEDKGQGLKPVCTSPTNNYWNVELTELCTVPLTNNEVISFCNQNSSQLTDFGKKECNRALVFVAKSKEQECFDKVEQRYQGSLKDARARETRREGMDSCREGSAALYPGAVFSGGGLRSGAIMAHEHLTKSISHETDIKALILGWTQFVLELVAVIAVVAVVWAGILYITDMGDGSNQEKAKKILMFVAIGIIVVLGSYAIVNTVMKADLGDSRAEINTSLHA
jgi:hypothetical protein